MERFEQIRTDSSDGKFLVGTGSQSYSQMQGKIGDTYIYTGPHDTNSIIYGHTTDGSCFGTRNCKADFTKTAELTKKGTFYTSSGIFIGSNLEAGEPERMSRPYQFMLNYNDANIPNTVLNDYNGVNKIGGSKTTFLTPVEVTDDLITRKSVLVNRLCLGSSLGTCTDITEKMQKYDENTQRLQDVENRYTELQKSKLDVNMYSLPKEDIFIHFHLDGMRRKYRNNERVMYGSNQYMNNQSQFVVPVTGLYFLQAKISSTNETNTAYVVGVGLRTNNNNVLSYNVSQNYVVGLTTSAMKVLNQGDMVEVYTIGNAPMTTFTTDAFTGYLVKAT